MSFHQIRRSLLVAAAAAVLALGGVLAGRLSADAFPQHTRGDFAPRLFGRIARALELTDDQTAQIKTILKAHSEEIQTQIEASAAARRALHDAIVAQPTDEAAIRARALDVGRIHGDGAVLFAKIRTEVDPILTPDQRQKLQNFRVGMRRHAASAARSFAQFLRSGS